MPVICIPVCTWAFDEAYNDGPVIWTGEVALCDAEVPPKLKIPEKMREGDVKVDCTGCDTTEFATVVGCGCDHAAVDVGRKT